MAIIITISLTKSFRMTFNVQKGNRAWRMSMKNLLKADAPKKFKQGEEEDS